ncbi:neuromedin-U receptor 2-like [Gigantopelta aegis]|uniref:neuromedin-U receptor 2-like n=1 Tax=Gigantopelta aegis TaxID=1735272 RepID=UPI001B889058|nr:neuromedin-U receptor 2-like [Gigantopelta aegis]XP_041361648.1 neuromedin-U receptor 2-like [Gigantopelta aegis]
MFNAKQYIRIRITSLPKANCTDMVGFSENVVHILIPVIVCVGVLGVFSIVGNVLVCYVFIFRMKTTTHNFLISSLSVFGLLSTVVCMALATGRMTRYYTFRLESICKAGMFLDSVLILMTIFILIIIAVDRYLKICRPMETQMTRKVAEISIGVAVCVSVLFGSPRLSVYIVKSVEATKPNGTQCIHDTNTVFTLYRTVTALLIIGLTVVLIVLYASIGIAVRRHKCSFQLSDRANNPRASINVRSPSLSRQNQNMFDKSTLIGFFVTLMFVISYFPALALKIIICFTKEDLMNKYPLGYYICQHMYIINDAVNPIIYGALNTEFRNHVVQMMRSISRRLKTSNSVSSRLELI